MQDVSENGKEVAGLEQPIDSSDKELSQVFDQSQCQNMFSSDGDNGCRGCTWPVNAALTSKAVKPRLAVSSSCS